MYAHKSFQLIAVEEIVFALFVRKRIPPEIWFLRKKLFKALLLLLWEFKPRMLFVLLSVIGVAVVSSRELPKRLEFKLRLMLLVDEFNKLLAIELNFWLCAALGSWLSLPLKLRLFVCICFISSRSESLCFLARIRVVLASFRTLLFDDWTRYVYNVRLCDELERLGNILEFISWLL